MTRSQLFAIAVASTVLAVLGVLVFDLPLSRWVADHDQSAAWAPIVKVCEYFVGVSPWIWTVPLVLCAGVVATLAVQRWRSHARAWMYVALVYLLSRNLMAWGKTLTGRYRPHQWIKIGGDTFGHIGDGASFPSGHVIVFAGLLLPLAVVVPRTRPLLLLIPFIMIARIAVLAHFASDVFAGLALSALLAWLCVPLLAPISAPAPRAVPARR